MPIPIHEYYGAYSAPTWVFATVEQFFASLPEEHVRGISCVVLTDTASSERGTTGRLWRRNRRSRVLGVYHPRWRNQPAWIELMVDQIADGIPWPLNRLPFWRDRVVARVLFDEVAHHRIRGARIADRGSPVQCSS